MLMPTNRNDEALEAVLEARARRALIMTAVAPLLGPSSVLWPDPETGPWLIVVTWGEVGGEVVPVGLEVRSFRNPNEGLPLPMKDAATEAVTTNLLRTLRLAELVEGLREKALVEALVQADVFGARPAGDDVLLGLAQERAGQRVAALTQRPRRGRPPLHGEDHYREVAEVYRTGARTGKPTQAVRKRFDLSRSQASKHIAEARRRSYLGPALPGRGGEAAQDTTTTPTTRRRTTK